MELPIIIKQFNLSPSEILSVTNDFDTFHSLNTTQLECEISDIVHTQFDNIQFKNCILKIALDILKFKINIHLLNSRNFRFITHFPCRLRF